jgi:hypothetical protein
MFRRTYRARGRILTERGQGLAVLLSLLAGLFLLVLKANGVS